MEAIKKFNRKLDYNLRVNIESSYEDDNIGFISIYTSMCSCYDYNSEGMYREHFTSKGTLKEILSLGDKYINFDKSNKSNKSIIYSKVTKKLYTNKLFLEIEERAVIRNNDLDKCCICLEYCTEELDRCDHILCSECLRKYTSTKKKTLRCPECPICREGIYHEKL